MNADSEYIYDIESLYSIVKNTELKDSFQIRPLKEDDYTRGYLPLLSQLTDVGQVSTEQFKKQFKHMQKNGSYYITVIEDLNTGKIIGAATLFVEAKFIHSCGTRGRIEDVVVDSDYRGQKLGKILVQTLKNLAQHIKCYKLTLDCKDDMIPWYQKFGFTVELGRSNFMTIRF